MAESNTLGIKYKKVVENFEVVFMKNNRKLRIGPVKSFMNQIIPDGLQIKLSIYKNTKRKRPVTSQTIVLEKSDDELFSLYRVACLHPFEKLDKMKYPGKYKVVSGTGKTSGGYKIKTELLSIKPINLILNIPH